MLKFTSQDHADFKDLEKAYSGIQDIVAIVNEAAKEQSNMRRIVEIQKVARFVFFFEKKKKKIQLP